MGREEGIGFYIALSSLGHITMTRNREEISISSRIVADLQMNGRELIGDVCSALWLCMSISRHPSCNRACGQVKSLVCLHIKC